MLTPSPKIHILGFRFAIFRHCCAVLYCAVMRSAVVVCCDVALCSAVLYCDVPRVVFLGHGGGCSSMPKGYIYGKTPQM